MKQIDLREGARRQHRAVSLFAVVQCWLRGLDGVVFDRKQLERLLGLKRFKGTRVDWMKDDFREFFPHQELYWSKGRSFHSLYVARVEIGKFLPSRSKSLTTVARIDGIAQGGPKLAKFEIWPRPNKTEVLAAFDAAIPFFADAVNYDERLLSSYLALLIQGQISPANLPKK